MKLRALAKINLGLDVTGKRPDGYHEVRMIMQNIQMFDQLEMEKSGQPGIRIETNLSFLPCNENNLVYRAADLLMKEFDIREGLNIRLTKFIPVAAGMAGGSSDAAAAMSGQPHVSAGALHQGTDGPRGKDRSGCALLCDAGNGSRGRNRGEADEAAADAVLLCADRKAGNQCVDKIRLRKSGPEENRTASGY